MLTNLASILALVVSLCSLTVSIFNYLRDRSKMRAWSRIEWHPYGYGDQKETPALRISVANVGRRPMLMLNLVKRAGRVGWSSTLKQPEVNEPGVVNVEKLVEIVQRSYVAQHTSVKLAEGEVYEFIFRPEEFPDEFILIHVDPPKTAEALFVEDVTGKLYEVKGAREHLRELEKAWMDQRSARAAMR